MNESWKFRFIIGSLVGAILAINIATISLIRSHKHEPQPEPELKAALAIPADEDASVILQALFDSGMPVELPAQRINVSRPIYLSSGAELIGVGRKSEIHANNRDALVVMPPAQRAYNPEPNIKANSLSPDHWAFRTNKNAGIRLMNTPADAGWTGAKHWSAVREFTVEFAAARHGNNGTLCGLSWNISGASYNPAPWRIWSHSERSDQIDFDLGLANGSTSGLRVNVGPASATVKTYRFKVDLNAGTIAFELNSIALAGQSTGEPLIAGATLIDNPGAPLWIGGGNSQAAGPCPPELDCADIEFHTWRLWKTANPPPINSYSPFANIHDTVCVMPFENSKKPVAGDPAVEFTGHLTAFGYLTPYTQTGAVDGIRIENVSFVGGEYGAGVTITSAYDVNINSVRFSQFAVGLQIMGGPLPCYPVRIKDVFGFAQHDCLMRIQRSIVSISEVTAKYPRRSVIRADGCGIISISDVFHAGENSGQSNSVTDVMLLSNCIKMKVNNVLSNYEDGPIGGPRRSYLKVTGTSPEPAQIQRLRVRDFGKQALRPGAFYLDTRGLADTCTIEVINSFDVDD